MDLIEYQDKTFEILESLDYPEIVLTYEPEDVAKTLHHTMFKLWRVRVSPMMCALTIYGHTIDKITKESANAKHH